MNKEILKDATGVHTSDRGPYITTYCGNKFYPLNPRIEEIHIRDIAHALSNQCRWAGHSQNFYSVAQHSVYVSHNVPPQLRLLALLHDASEAYLVDLPRPLKVLVDFSAYRSLEKSLQHLIYQKHNLVYTADDYKFVKYADNLLLATEARDLMHNPEWCIDMPKLAWTIPSMGAREAEEVFLDTYYDYTN